MGSLVQKIVSTAKRTGNKQIRCKHNEKIPFRDRRFLAEVFRQACEKHYGTIIRTVTTNYLGTARIPVPLALYPQEDIWSTLLTDYSGYKGDLNKSLRTLGAVIEYPEVGG